jgi:hypothetical protein
LGTPILPSSPYIPTHHFSLLPRQSSLDRGHWAAYFRSARDWWSLPMPDQSSKPHRSPFARAGHEGTVRGADQDARLAAELRRNLLRRKQQQRARADGASIGEAADDMEEGSESGGGRHER